MIRVLLSAPLCLHIWLSSRFTCWPEIWIVPRGALQHDAARSGGAVALVRRAWTTAQGPMAISDSMAESPPCRCVDAHDGTRRGERSSGDRDGQAPGANAPGAQTHGTRGVAGGHPSSPGGRPD